MSGCPVHTGNVMRSELPPLTGRLAALPIDKRGYPVPWFVARIDGEPDHRIGDPVKLVRAIRFKLCWVCGEALGQFRTFVIGPMCAVNRVTAEPPTHRECAEYSVKACPFLTRPYMRRREAQMPYGVVDAAGCMIRRNPGVMVLWTTRDYKIFIPRGDRMPLFKLGDPTDCEWWTEGRIANLSEVQAAFDGGLPALVSVAEREGAAAVQALEQACERVKPLLPPA